MVIPCHMCRSVFTYRLEPQIPTLRLLTFWTSFFSMMKIFLEFWWVFFLFVVFWKLLLCVNVCVICVFMLYTCVCERMHVPAQKYESEEGITRCLPSISALIMWSGVSPWTGWSYFFGEANSEQAPMILFSLPP